MQAVEVQAMANPGILNYFENAPAPIESYQVVATDGTKLAGTTKGPKYNVSVLKKEVVKFERTENQRTDQLVVPLSSIVAAAYSGANELTIVVSGEFLARG
jgi:hypothetical protein